MNFCMSIYTHYLLCDRKDRLLPFWLLLKLAIYRIILTIVIVNRRHHHHMCLVIIILVLIISIISIIKTDHDLRQGDVRRISSRGRPYALKNSFVWSFRAPA
ncbi:hypothetical protein F5Y02DRAFT_65329 [Annulohypoxylon stygium]|nr:hypothetical protein F5Y02DRAFT_65329 [Annulohypoxylon stygium]